MLISSSTESSVFVSFNQRIFFIVQNQVAVVAQPFRRGPAIGHSIPPATAITATSHWLLIRAEINSSLLIDLGCSQQQERSDEEAPQC